MTVTRILVLTCRRVGEATNDWEHKLVCDEFNIAQGRNLGVRHARNELIAVTDSGCVVSDTQWSANRILSAIQGWLVQQEFIREHPVLICNLPGRELRRLTEGALLKRGLEAFWARDLGAAHAILRAVARTGYGSLRDWKYILPALLPLGLYRGLVKLIDTANWL